MNLPPGCTQAEIDQRFGEGQAYCESFGCDEVLADPEDLRSGYCAYHREKKGNDQ
jgi:hypothetical protein